MPQHALSDIEGRPGLSRIQSGARAGAASLADPQHGLRGCKLGARGFCMPEAAMMSQQAMQLSGNQVPMQMLQSALWYALSVH